ncbi:hypothetical protein OC25_02650 [Pedobacter kyungheensis]|uniref:HTTM-like domain-containing protein n=1 Tax=Pedobacter kyungheensis TaxID=1069985 RepID=A0A0C1DRJ2_9SPHI|nr:HTTM domain-containing protein [Pedobacter kyungheensis]KIA96640.1 hypothetical protein OC25_02650 [Pedobacter kyungheensis]
MLVKLRRYFFDRREEDMLFLLFFRVSVSLFLLIHFFSLGKDFNYFYSNDGLIPLRVQNVYNESFSLPKLLDYLYKEFDLNVEKVLLSFKVCYSFLCLALFFGFFSRLSSFFLIILHLLLVRGTPFYSYGVDYFSSIALFYCLIFPLDQYSSLRNLILKNNFSVNPTPFRRLLQLHLGIMYFFSGFGKLLGFNWWNGESIWKAIHLPYFNYNYAGSFDYLSKYPIIFVLLGWGTILIELLYPIFMNFKRTRLFWLLLVVSLHVGIAFILNLYFFSAIMIIINVAGFGNFRMENQKP